MKKRRTASLERRQQRWGLMFVIPFLIGLLFFVAVPFVKAVSFSFCDLKKSIPSACCVTF